MGQVTVAVKNCAPVELQLARNDFIGNLENVTGCETRELNPAYVQAVARATNNKPTEQLTSEKKQFIEQTIRVLHMCLFAQASVQRTQAYHEICLL